ncbi:MAG: AraC family transcriptional regulator [Spirochaetales bacterium]|nr:AraC family transcriptional regulator [Spirochaetales bacterium]
METRIIHIKNMKCQRCIWAVEEIINNLEIRIEKISLGEVTIKVSDKDVGYLDELKTKLKKIGFELIESKNMQTVEQIKAYIVYWLQKNPVEMQRGNLSDFLSAKMALSYGTISKVFSEVENITIEKYYIHQRIGKAKELILFDEQNFEEISYELGYSSLAHFSSQFKSITGYSPLQYKKKLKQ